jgi:hypothetical protein
VNPNDKRRADRKSQTLQEAFDVFILSPTRTKSKRPRATKTTKDYRLQFKSYLDGWKDRRLVQISRTDVETLRNKLGEENGHYVANRTLALLKAIYNAAIDAGYGRLGVGWVGLPCRLNGQHLNAENVSHAFFPKCANQLVTQEI